MPGRPVQTMSGSIDNLLQKSQFFTEYSQTNQFAFLKPQTEPEKRQEQVNQFKNQAEWKKCSESADYFIETYCKIYDATSGDWIPFTLWVEQQETLTAIDENQLTIILKARQLGLTWLVLCYALWLMLFKPIATVLLFSLRETEAAYLLSEDRMRGIYNNLPGFLQLPEQKTNREAAKLWKLANGSTARAFPTSAGDSYTATLAVVDEADLVPDLNKLMRRVKPTIDAGGKMILLSRSDKSQPQSEFKKIYRSAKQKLNDWKAIFLAWYVRPQRTKDWYEAQRRDILQRTGSLDDLHEQYPSTDVEALAPRSLDKRIHPDWLNKCYEEIEPLESSAAPGIPGLTVYRIPQTGRRYVISGDPAEGNPTSDDSASTILDWHTGEEVAKFNGKFQPKVFAAHIDRVGTYYNSAPAMIERNNHGHSVILWLQDNSKLRVIDGIDGRPGWLDNSRGKAMLYDDCAEAFRTEDTIIHSFDTFTQLCSIEGSTLLAPDGEPDDLADSYALCCVARARMAKAASPPAAGGVRPAQKNFRVL